MEIKAKKRMANFGKTAFGFGCCLWEFGRNCWNVATGASQKAKKLVSIRHADCVFGTTLFELRNLRLGNNSL